MTLKIGALCAGYGGLDMGLAMALPAKPAWFCEFADGPSKILDHHYPELPNHRDLTETDWSTVEPVDVVTAGWPCQPWSVAGAQRGVNDERAIWPAIATAIRSLRPKFVALENVSAIVGVGELARAVGDLAALGYDAQWQCVRASDVGAPHRRERCFILASNTSKIGRRRGTRPNVKATPNGRPGDAPDTGFTPDSDDSRRQRRGAIQLGGTPVDVAGHGKGSLSNSEGEPGRVWDGDDVRARGAAVEREQDAGRSAPTDWGRYQPAIERWGQVVGRSAPKPTEPSVRGNERLSPLLVEWFMGVPEGWVTGVPGLSRNEQLRALGNGVVPQQAAFAYSGLLGVAGELRDVAV